MKTKTWILLLGILLLVTVGLSLVFLLPGEPAQQAQVLSDGKLLYTLSLQEDREVTVESQWGTNVITVRDGKIAVTEADCPTGVCKARGFCNSGPQIVCLPHHLVIRFVGKQGADSVVG